MLTTWTLSLEFFVFSLLFLDRTTQRSPVFSRIKREPSSSWWPGLGANYPKQGWAVRAMGILTLPQHPPSQSKAGMVDPERERTHLCPVSTFLSWLLSGHRVGSGNESQGQTGGCLQPPHEKKNTQSTLCWIWSLSGFCMPDPRRHQLCTLSKLSAEPCVLPAHSTPWGKVLCQALVKVNR